MVIDLTDNIMCSSSPCDNIMSMNESGMSVNFDSIHNYITAVGCKHN